MPFFSFHWYFSVNPVYDSLKLMAIFYATPVNYATLMPFVNKRKSPRDISLIVKKTIKLCRKDSGSSLFTKFVRACWTAEKTVDV